MEGIILGAVSLALGVTLVWSKAEKILKALKEVAEVLLIISTSLEDKKLSSDELVEIKKEAREAIAALKGILK